MAQQAIGQVRLLTLEAPVSLPAPASGRWPGTLPAPQPTSTHPHGGDNMDAILEWAIEHKWWLIALSPLVLAIIVVKKTT